jgi:hypothetical protein
LCHRLTHDLRSEKFNFQEMSQRMAREPENQPKEMQALLVRRAAVVAATATVVHPARCALQRIFSDMKLKYLNLETRQGLLEAVIQERESVFSSLSAESVESLSMVAFLLLTS